jgi:hypothetical protein
MIAAWATLLLEKADCCKRQKIRMVNIGLNNLICEG